MLGRVLKTTLRLVGSLEGVNSTQKAVILTVILYYNKRLRLNSSKGTGLLNKVQDKPGTSFQLSCPKNHMGTFNFPAMVYENACKLLPTGEAHMSLGVQRFYLGVVIHVCYTFVTELSYSGSGFPEQTQVFSINYLSKLA